ncbi:transposable element Tc1 transposase [Trichonephila clavipes]|nr:transposable element Tc1 transposase [Trichonephila clavipes]
MEAMVIHSGTLKIATQEAGQVDRSECAVRNLLGALDTKRYPRAENRDWSDQENHEERENRRIMWKELVDPTVTRSTIRADVDAGQVDRSECAVRNLLGALDTKRYPRAENRDWSDQENHEERENRRIMWKELVDPTVTRSTIRADVDVGIFPQTISRHLAETNLKFKRPFRVLPLTPEHRQLRLQWCQARSMWNVTDWQKVVFSDESRFVLGTDDNRVRVWRRSGPFGNGLPGAIFQQDNARSHTARVAQDFLRHFQTLSRPTRSPDLSPVEHMWVHLKRQLASCHSVHDLELAFQEL